MGPYFHRTPKVFSHGNLYYCHSRVPAQSIKALKSQSTHSFIMFGSRCWI